MGIMNHQFTRATALVLMQAALVLSACSARDGSELPTNPDELTTSRGGQAVFQQRCAGCHNTNTEPKIGPGLAGLFSPGGPRLPSGVDYGGKLPNGKDITEANVIAWIREGGRGDIGSMPGMPVNDQEMVGLIAYLQTLEQ